MYLTSYDETKKASCKKKQEYFSRSFISLQFLRFNFDWACARPSEEDCEANWELKGSCEVVAIRAGSLVSLRHRVAPCTRCYAPLLASANLLARLFVDACADALPHRPSCLRFCRTYNHTLPVSTQNTCCWARAVWISDLFSLRLLFVVISTRTFNSTSTEHVARCERKSPEISTRSLTGTKRVKQIWYCTSTCTCTCTIPDLDSGIVHVHVGVIKGICCYSRLCASDTSQLRDSRCQFTLLADLIAWNEIKCFICRAPPARRRTACGNRREMSWFYFPHQDVVTGDEAIACDEALASTRVRM